MATNALMKRTATPGATLSASDIAVGEIGMNTSDGILFVRTVADTIIAIGREPTILSDIDGGDAAGPPLAPVIDGGGA